MHRKFVFTTINIVLLMGILLTGCGMSDILKPGCENVRIILHRKWKKTVIPNQSPYFSAILQESEKLFKTSDASYLFIVDKGLISALKKDFLLEIIYPKTETSTILFRTTYFTRLFIPLRGRWADNGTVFYQGVYEPAGKSGSGDSTYYRAVANTKQGVNKLQEYIRKMKI
ncbi:MAG: hypothetical protein GY795_33415 [Desulfobacterales bacterium]|nr:hypothetical protein [Desulfobacterales bacterium]